MKRILILLAAILCVCSCANGPKASYTQKDGIHVVELYGTWSQMGEQYGRFMAGSLEGIYDTAMGIIGDDDAKNILISNFAEGLYKNYPARFKQFFQGVSKASGLPLEQIQLCNAIEYSGRFLCSGFAAWADYTTDGTLVYGRNYDGEGLMTLKDYLTLTVFHPSDGSIPTAIFGLAGELYAVNAVNANGVFMELNNGTPSAGRKVEYDKCLSTTRLLEMMFDATDIEYANTFIHSTTSSQGFIIGLADKTEARVLEWCQLGCKRSDSLTPYGCTAMANHFVNPEWPFAIPTDSNSWNSITRRSNIVDLAEKNKGRIDFAKMQTIMSTPIEEGGPMSNTTFYSMVFSPATMTMSVSLKGSGIWTNFNLKELL